LNNKTRCIQRIKEAKQATGHHLSNVINQLGPSFIDQRASFGKTNKQRNKSKVRFAYDMQMGLKEMAN